eukprot:m.52055 g.52055  ORF g.52055 m.52055 type:complete len:1903 (+) comp10770_c0_seq2:130-5838(+)
MTSTFIDEGARSWFKDQGGNWQPCTAGKVNGQDGTQSFKGDNGETYTIAGSNIGPQSCAPMHRSSIESVADMATLGDLHEGAILYNMKLRYKENLIYTYIGSILAAVNPYKKIEGIYSDEKIIEYKGKPIGELAPHVYAIANESYANMWKSDVDQVVLISGESGSGKTESTKFMLRFLSFLSNEIQSQSEGGKSFEEQILQSNPVMEAFGNAKTVYNNNSSRFGKFMSVQFNNSGVIEGGKIIDYLLEKNRVARQNPQERTFHIFYALVSGCNADKYKVHSGLPENYHFLSQSGVTKVDTIDDKENWKEVVAAFDLLDFTADQTDAVTRVLSAILLIGNITFDQAGGAQIKNPKILEQIAELLGGIQGPALGEGLTEKKRLLRGEVIATPLDLDQARDARDSLAMAIYACLFKFLIKKINITLKGPSTFHTIGILDIFGFENFENNFLEQFNINYANEKLQQYFNQHIFSLEQIEYTKEGLEWTDIDYVDNSDCLDLIERRLGVISLIDEEARMPKGTDESLKNKLHSRHGGSPYYVKPRMQGTLFGINHFAGAVMYEITGIVEKNRDTFREDLLDVLVASDDDFIVDLFDDVGDNGSSKGTSRRKATLCVQFKDSLISLMKILNAANPHFVRCVKPNMAKKANSFTDKTVLNQLRYSGMMETVKIRRAGYPVRREFADFLFRFRVLAAGQDKSISEAEQCAAVLKKYDSSGKDWKIGHTKAFMREKVEIVLEDARAKELQVTIEKIKAFVVAAIFRKRMASINSAIVKVQAWMKGCLARIKYLSMKKSAIRIQANYRGYLARKLYTDMKEEHALQQEIKREAARQEEENRLAEMARKEEEHRIAAAERALEIKRKEEEAKLAAERSKEEAEAAAKALEEAKAKALAEEKAAEEEAAREKEEEEAKAKARAAEEAKAKEDEEREIREAVEKSKDLQVEQDAVAAKKAEEAEKERLQAEMAKKQAALIESQAKLEAEAAEDAAAEGEDEGDDDGGDIEEEEFDDEEEDEMMEYREGYLGMYRGVLNNLKKRWCVLHEGTFMWFKGQQNFIRAGWLTKMGGGTSTFGRTNWKKRWMTLKGGELHYHETEDDEAKILGIVDIQNCESIVDGDEEDIGIKKENAFAIETSSANGGKKRTYYMHADSPEEKEDWLMVLNEIKGKTDDEIREMMMNARVDPRNAQGTIELEDIVTVTPVEKTDNDGHPVFVVMCNNRAEKFIAADADDMDDWIRVLQPKKGSGEGQDEHDIIEQGFLMKGGGQNGMVKRRRYFILRGDVISYYKSQHDPSTLVGSIPLNALCSVVAPDDSKPGNDWTFVVHSRRKSFELTSKTQTDCNKWINAIQEVIDNAPDIETPTEKLIEELKMASPPEVEAIYLSQKVLTYQPEPLRAPLLPLPYGETTKISNRVYDTLQAEAMKVNLSLLPPGVAPALGARAYGDPRDPVALIKNICQACFDVPKLRNEVYCQVIKMTTNFPEPGSPLNLTHWHLLGALCSCFLPSRKFVRFLRFHLRRTLEHKDFNGEEVCTVASFCLDALKKTKGRDFPPSTEEIKGIMNGTGLQCTIHCVGGQEIELKIGSSTTCGDVIGSVKEKLKLSDCANGFGLFESCGLVDKYLEEKMTIADTLSKWEKYQAHGINPDGGQWKLVFKLFSFYDPLNPNLSKVEQEFLFEQAFESVMNRRYPADEKMLIELAALRTQFVVGDYEDGAYISDLIKVHPAQQPQLLSSSSSGGTIVGTLKKAGTMFKAKTLRGFGKGTLKKLKGDGTMKGGSKVGDAELEKIKKDIVLAWKPLKGLSPEDARVKFMEIIHSWNGYGANLFEVVQTTNTKWPKELWLAVSLEGVGVFPRGERKCLAFYRYETVLSFGAPVANKYKIMIDGVGSMLFETNMVLEIAKLMKEYIKTIVTRRG